MPQGFETFDNRGQKIMDHNSLTAKHRGVFTSEVWTGSGVSTGTIVVENKRSEDTIFCYPILVERRQADGRRNRASGLQISFSGANINWVFDRGTWGGSFMLIYGVY